MATNAFLYALTTKPNGEKQWLNIFVYSDGYLAGVGKVLNDHYTDPAKVEALFALGDVSILDANIDCPEGHTFGKRAPNTTVFYGRDRGEDDCEACPVYCHEIPGRFCIGLLNPAKCSATEYVWDGSAWYTYDAGFDLAPDNMGLLSEVLALTGKA